MYEVFWAQLAMDIVAGGDKCAKEWRKETPWNATVVASMLNVLPHHQSEWGQNAPRTAGCNRSRRDAKRFTEPPLRARTKPPLVLLAATVVAPMLNVLPHHQSE